MEGLQKDIHDFRKQIDSCIKALVQSDVKPNGDNSVGFGSEYQRCREKAYTNLQEAKMWMGKCLEAIGSEFPEELRDEAE